MCSVREKHNVYAQRLSWHLQTIASWLSMFVEMCHKSLHHSFQLFFLGDGMLQNTLLENGASQPCADVANSFISESGGSALQAPLHY